MASASEVMSQLKSIGITEHDAQVITDCVITRRSCSWVNTDPVDEKVLRDLHDVIKRNNYGVQVIVQAVPTRSKYIWEVKVR